MKRAPLMALVSILLLSAVMQLKGADAEGGIVYERIGVHVEIKNHYVTIDVGSTILNEGDQTEEVIYYIGIPDSSYLTNMSLTVDGITHYARVIEREKANQQYDDAKESNLTAMKLSATHDPSLYYINLNIKPGKQIDLTYRIERILWKYLDEYTFSLQLDDLGEYASFSNASFTLDMRSPADIKEFSYSCQPDLDKLPTSPNNAKLYKDGYDPSEGDHIEIIFKEEAPPINGSLYGYTEGDEGYFMHAFSPQLEDLGSYLPKDICFVLDRSGSMEGDKISQLKDAFGEIVNQLHPEDRFNVITFSSDVQTHWDSLVEADDENIVEASTFITDISAGGSTNIDGALKKGLSIFDINEEAVPIIVFLTDGLPTEGETDPAVIRSNIKSSNSVGASIYSLGFGSDLDYEFLNALSLENQGHAVSIPVGADASSLMTNFYDTISVPLLMDITFSYTMGTSYVLPSYAPSLFQGSEIVVVGRFDPDMERITATVSGTTRDGVKVFEESFLTTGDYNTPFIKRLWAQRYILNLLDRIAVEGENATLVQQVVDMGIQYSFVTPYTSMILVVEDPQTMDAEKEGAGDRQEGDYNGEIDDGSPSTIDGGGGSGGGITPPEEEKDQEEGGNILPDFDPFNIPKGSSDDSSSFIILVLAGVVLLIILLFIGFFIYSRIREADLLEQENRKRIYDHIVEHPGDHFREVQRAVDLEVGVLSHHVNILEKEQLIVSEQDGQYRRFYAAGVKREGKVRLSRIQRNILSSIEETPGITQSRIAREVGVSRKVVYYHVKFLTSNGIVEEQRVKRKPRYYPA